MKNITIAFVAGLAFIGAANAQAQTVSGGDAYAQGYAAGAASKETNDLNLYESGVKAGADVATGQQTQQAFNTGVAVGATAQQTDAAQAYTNGYNDRAAQEVDKNNRAYMTGFDAGARAQSKLDDKYPQ